MNTHTHIRTNARTHCVCGVSSCCSCCCVVLFLLLLYMAKSYSHRISHICMFKILFLIFCYIHIYMHIIYIYMRIYTYLLYIYVYKQISPYISSGKEKPKQFVGLFLCVISSISSFVFFFHLKSKKIHVSFIYMYIYNWFCFCLFIYYLLFLLIIACTTIQHNVLRQIFPAQL